MSEISFINIDASRLVLNDKEICRYLNVKSCDEGVFSLINDCKQELYRVALPKAVYVKSMIKEDEGKICLGFGEICSNNLSKNLSGCGEVFVFCATLGQEVDRLIKKYSKIEPSKALVLDATASTMVEAFCDYVNEFLGENRILRPRFSCGYGDFSLEHQGAILEFLETKKRIGVGLLDSYMMTPFKTVTAVIGIER